MPKNAFACSGAQQSYPENQFCLVSVQQMQTLLILFSKSFSYFPHGACLLSDSIIYSCFDGNYHPLYIPMPRNVTLQSRAVHRHVHMAWGGFTLFGAFFQQACTCTSIGNASQNYNSKLAAQFFRMNISLFIRNYLRNPFWFIFHSLLICLNSAGLNTSLHVRIESNSKAHALQQTCSHREALDITFQLQCALTRRCPVQCIDTRTRADMTNHNHPTVLHRSIIELRENVRQ